MNYFQLHGKIALVTGASSGIGFHISQTLAAEGCTVAVAARRMDRLSQLVRSIEDAGGRAIAVEMDVTDREAIANGLDKVETEAGPVEILVNNAGRVGCHPFLTATKDETDQVVAVNQTAVWDVAQAVAQRLVEQKMAGSIINISSITGLSAVGGQPVTQCQKPPLHIWPSFRRWKCPATASASMPSRRDIS